MNRRWISLLALPLALALAAPAVAKEAPPKAAWLKMTEAQRRASDVLARDYMRFLDEAKIPLQRAEYLVDMAEKAGFRPFRSDSPWKPGAKYYLLNRQKALMLVVVGRKSVTEGVRLIGAHLDSPRLDLRIRPLKSTQGFLVLKTAPYGGIKRYQWANLPLALVGRVATADGRMIDVSIGHRPGDPVFVLPDLAPHVDKEYRKREMDEVFKGEELSPLAASLPSADGDVRHAFMAALKARYNLVEEDFVSSELSFVPAVPPREVGLDRGLIGSYGQDDALCSFVAARALMNLKTAPEKTSMVYLVDHEEVGNVNNTGVRSRFLIATLDRLAARESGTKWRPDLIHGVLERSEALSADVSQAINPLFPNTEDPVNTAHVGQGFTLKSMKPGLDGSPAMRAGLRRLLADRQIPWQTYAYKVDGGGGKTIGSELQEYNMDVVDVGVPLLAMHGTYELSSKADVFALERFFGAFLQGR